MKLKNRKLTIIIVCALVIQAAGIGLLLRSLHTAKKESQRLALPTTCENGHTTLTMVTVQYGLTRSTPETTRLDHMDLVVQAGSVATPDSPAFILRCTTCGWETPGWSIALMNEVAPGRTGQDFSPAQ